MGLYGEKDGEHIFPVEFTSRGGFEQQEVYADSPLEAIQKAVGSLSFLRDTDLCPADPHAAIGYTGWFKLDVRVGPALPKYQVIWNNPSASGTLTGIYLTEEDAEDAGRNWKLEMLALEPTEAARAEADEEYYYDVVEASSSELTY